MLTAVASPVNEFGTLKGIPDNLMKVFRFVQNGLAKVPNLKQHLSMNQKQYFYKGHDVSHHFYAMKSAFQTGKSAHGDNYRSYGYSLG